MRVEELGWIELDPDVTFRQRLFRCSFEGGVNPNITADKSNLKVKVWRFIVLYGPGKDISSKDMRVQMVTNGDRACDIDDGIGIAYEFPDLQESNTLVLLDKNSACIDGEGIKHTPALKQFRGRRSFYLLNLNPWPRGILFPAVRTERYKKP